MNKEYLLIECRKASITHPHLKDEICGIYNLCCQEISEGNSEAHEVEIALEDLNQTIKED